MRLVHVNGFLMPAPQLETIIGEVLDTRILGADFWGSATVRVAGRTKADRDVKVVGKLLSVQVGDTIEVRGCVTMHPKFGAQFKAQSIATVVPRDSSGVVAWLSSRLPQLGTGRASALVEKFGAEGVWDVIEHRPDELLNVPGITPERRDAIVDAYWKHRGERDRIVRLKSWGLTDGQIAAVVAEWGASVEERLRTNPFQLIEHVHGFGFKRADAVASRMGLPSDAPARIRAGLVHVMREAEEDGHCFLHGGRLVSVAAKLLELGAEPVARELRMLVQSEGLVRLGDTQRVALPDIATAEANVARRARAFSSTTGPTGTPAAASTASSTSNRTEHAA